MNPKRIFITGASGCIGHYITQALIHHTEHELYLLVRNPDRLKVDLNHRPGIELLRGDMQHIDRYAPLLQTINVAVLTATAWGGGDVFDVNVLKTMQLMQSLDPAFCEQVIYFSTASILDRRNQPLKEARQLGTDYIRTKYDCYSRLSRLAIASRITTLFPTLVFGGEDTGISSHLTKGLPDVLKWINLIRFLKAEGSFHFIHAGDIAQIVLHLIENPPDTAPHLVLGNQPVTVNQIIEEICAYLDKKIYFRIPLSDWLTDLIINWFKIQMSPWDCFCLNYRHFTYENAVSPASFGLTNYCHSITDILKRTLSPESQSDSWETVTKRNAARLGATMTPGGENDAPDSASYLNNFADSEEKKAELELNQFADSQANYQSAENGAAPANNYPDQPNQNGSIDSSIDPSIDENN
ncbi:NAD-dependent epimerase/dehydratase family protein [Planktothricoides raciborskii]|uniref:NAD(P)-dependent oxidoreductase n=2 Tax=Planktothricoides raciborskii TaxID=132608 RepID=A0AAU8JGD0_9CYAN|nr:NAD(P)-dependent oxidoreductase [Planktothricoides raciborskii]MBD2545290.1 NAD(P)-dependent oxidoreductase [Planktothricoides raciborskii FACHB-1370]MBD2584356.1 NAD(P)-dependent oxidoreductase [Planktothricoides raciborskii FACHB-1261]